MNQYSNKIKKLEDENQYLLFELEKAYKNLESILRQSKHEQDIAYQELDHKYEALENLYSQLSNKENMLIHMEKLSSIGQFITEIIHELNNPLTVIKGISELLMFDNISDSIKNDINRIAVQTDRMTNYLNRFKVMAYKGEQDFSLFNLNENINNFIDTIEIIKPKSVNIIKNISNDVLQVWGDPYQISQIFLNLAKNAFDALKEHGQNVEIISRRINKEWLSNSQISSETSCISKNDLKTLFNHSNIFAFVEIKDDGPGIPEEFIANIFDAFFTSKERGKGTGLGLSIATDIAKRHGANLSVKSDFGKGTSFKFIIPLSNKKPKSKSKPAGNKRKSRVKKETLII